MKTSETASVTAGCLVIILIASAAIGSVCWPYTINYWLVVAGHAPAVCWYHGALLGFVPFVGQATIPLAVITWIASLFM